MLYFFKFCFIIIRFGISLLLVRKKAQKLSELYLTEIEETLRGKFDVASFKKITRSHSVYLAIVNDSFTLLHGRTTSQIEQERSINYFICSSLFDNFFDDKQLTIEEIESITFQPQQFIPSSFDQKAFLKAHLFLLNGMPDPTDYLKVLRNEFLAQATSLEQFDKAISNEEIQEITFEKGGNAVLMCRYYLDIIPTREEEQCWYQLGTMIQLSNDLFDIYKDNQQNIQTLAVRCKDAFKMEHFYTEQVNKMKKNIDLLPYSNYRKLVFSISMAATYSLGFTAIDRLKKIQGKESLLPNLHSVIRKDLIIDMEKPLNIFRWLIFVYKFGKLSAT